MASFAHFILKSYPMDLDVKNSQIQKEIDNKNAVELNIFIFNFLIWNFNKINHQYLGVAPRDSHLPYQVSLLTREYLHHVPSVYLHLG